MSRPDPSVPPGSLKRKSLPGQFGNVLGISASANPLGRGDSEEINSARMTMSAASSPRNQNSRNQNIVPCPNTTCEYCGNSYLTMSELRALQTKVKDQEEKLKGLKEVEGENLKLKENLGNIRKIHRQDISKRDEECQRWVVRCTTIENELERLKEGLKVSERKNSDLASKYAIAAEDFKQQEELICTLRSQLLKFEDSEGENNSLRMKNFSLEENLQRLLQEIKSLRSTDGSKSVGMKADGGFGNTTTEIALKAKISELMDRCGRLASQNNLYQQEIANLLQKQSIGAKGESPKAPSKISSVVSVEVHDLKRENSMLSTRLQALTDEHSNCQDMHAFLRESIEKLKTDNARLLDEMNSSRVKYEESLLKIENFQAVISGYQSERNRFMASYKDQQNKLEQLSAQNRAFHKSSDPETIQLLKSNLSSLQRLLHQTQQDKDKSEQEFNAKLSSIQKEVSMEKERADSVLTQSLREREEVESRWQERWSKHHSKLNDQLEILKSNYESSLKSSKEREDSLHSEILTLQDKLNKYSRSWEDYREKVNEEMNSWRLRVEELEQQLLNTEKGKVDVEVMFQEKTIQLEELHEALREGVEERQELQRKNEYLERSIQESAFSNSEGSFSNFNFNFNSANQPPKNSNSPLKPREEVPQENSAEIENALLWKQSQNLGAVQKEVQKEINSQNPSPRQELKQKKQSKSDHRQRPTSPFPVPSPGGKSFGNPSKNLKTTSTGNMNMNSTAKDSKEKNTRSKNKTKNSFENSNPEGPMVFSIAAPNPSRKPHRK